MLSISRTESRIVEFLLRRFSESYTIRKLANELKVSPAGAHKGVKKLEIENILTTERIGASLVCKVNLENPVAEHLAALLLVESDQKKKPGIKIEADAAILHKKKLLIINNNESEHIEGLETISLTQNELLLKLLKKDQLTLEIIREGTFLFGELTIVKTIKSRGIL